MFRPCWVFHMSCLLPRYCFRFSYQQDLAQPAHEAHPFSGIELVVHKLNGSAPGSALKHLCNILKEVHENNPLLPPVVAKSPDTVVAVDYAFVAFESELWTVSQPNLMNWVPSAL
jgi:hypothetical protein